MTLAVRPTLFAYQFVYELCPATGPAVELRDDAAPQVAGEPLAKHVFHHRRARLRRIRARLGAGAPHHLVRIGLPGSMPDDAGSVVVDLRLHSPVSPQELGLGGDTRRLGLHLVWLEVEPAGR